MPPHSLPAPGTAIRFLTEEAAAEPLGPSFSICTLVSDRAQYAAMVESFIVGSLAIRISDPHGEDQRRGTLPAHAASLDEDFVVLRRAAPVGLSADMDGFHLYGADLCLQARLAGRSAWVIDVHLRHLSPGRVDATFDRAKNAFERKYFHRFAGLRRSRTTCTMLQLRRSRFGPLRQLLRRPARP
jgi:hypothetical protein